MSDFWKKLRKEAYMTFARPVAKRLPNTDWGDRAAYRHGFYTRHGRWPGNRMLFNDVLFRIKSGPEIVSPERTFTSDKEFVKTYVAGIAGNAYNVPTLAILRTAEDVETFDVPEPCVIKPTHGCGSVTILKDGAEPDRAALANQLTENYYFVARERNYRQLKGKLIVEPLLFAGQDVNDYKVFCWKGQARCILYVNDRNRSFYRHLFDTDWNLLPVELSPFDMKRPIPPRPKALEEMLSVAEQLSKPFGFVRVDFYLDQDRVLVGEITHCHQGGNEKFRSLQDEMALSRLIWGTI
ncbi:ATP-grasp fold amidoligase family protein [Ruegeria jejuensis]|uniref:ATP-grasp fold amidoligase family protein n=1 Tax=Ruegeria jejuensis TaxID=3233338 RepID=UPI00355B754B